MTEFEDQLATSFEIIAAVGTARSSYINAIRLAKNGDFDAANAAIEEGKQLYAKGHDAHFGLIQREAAGTPTAMCLMLTHAEDQLMSAEGFGILAEEFVDLYRLVHEKD